MDDTAGTGAGKHRAGAGPRASESKEHTGKAVGDEMERVGWG